MAEVEVEGGGILLKFSSLSLAKLAGGRGSFVTGHVVTNVFDGLSWALLRYLSSSTSKISYATCDAQKSLHVLPG